MVKVGQGEPGMMGGRAREEEELLVQGRESLVGCVTEGTPWDGTEGTARGAKEGMVWDVTGGSVRGRTQGSTRGGTEGTEGD